MLFNKRFMLILILILFSLVLIGCADSEPEESVVDEQKEEPEPISEEHQALLDELHRDLEAMLEEDEDNENNENNSDQDQVSEKSTTAVDGFKHEVEMDIDGVVVEGHEDEWWVVD